MNKTMPLLLAAVIGGLVVRAADVRKSAGPQSGRNHIVRVVTVSQEDLDRRSRDYLEQTLARLDQAASFQPDIVCLPEVFPRGPAEPVPGPVTNRLSDWARKHGCYVVAGLKTKTNGRVYNSAVLIDRKGEITGQFNKMHPTEGELQEGIVPGGVDPPVFQTDFGVIGIQICFDVNWWDNWKRLKEKGAKIVFFPSAYPAYRQVAALALTNQFYVVSSPTSRQAHIYDITGKVLAASGHAQHWAAAALPMGKRLFETDFHVKKAREIQQKYGSKVELEWFHDDDWFTLASVDPELTTEEIIAEFGLTPLNDYRVRATKAVESNRQ